MVEFLLGEQGLLKGFFSKGGLHSKFLEKIEFKIT